MSDPRETEKWIVFVGVVLFLLFSWSHIDQDVRIDALESQVSELQDQADACGSHGVLQEGPE